MSFLGALTIILGLAVIGLGLLTYHLLTRLHLIEDAVSGGMRAPSRTLSREEFGRRFSTARKRAEFARDHQQGVVLFLDERPSSTELLDSLAHLSQTRGFGALFGAKAPTGTPHEIILGEDQADRMESLGVTAVPFCFVVDASTIVEARPVGSAAAFESLLLEVAQ